MTSCSVQPYRHEPGRRWSGRSISLGWLIAAYATAGILHLTLPGPFISIVPGWVPWPGEVVRLTGLCELAGALGLVIPRTRRLAGFMLALYAVCVFPANLYHALSHVHVPPLPDSWWYHGPRLLAQPVLVWWALYASGVIDWPFANRVAAQAPTTHPGEPGAPA